MFSKWLEVSHLGSNDMLLVFSVGGGDLHRNISPNLVRALELAKRVGAKVCGVVGQPNQFASGALYKGMRGSGVGLASEVANRVLAGGRHPALPYTTHFHTAGLTFPYNNMHYVLVAGGNAFYEVY